MKSTSNWDTYTGWIKRGRHVNQGEKSRRRNNRTQVPMFHREQTSPIEDIEDWGIDWTNADYLDELMSSVGLR